MKRICRLSPSQPGPPTLRLLLHSLPRRVDGQKRYAYQWAAMRSCFDQAMAHHWEQARTKGLQRHNFVDANFASLGLLMD